MLIFFAQIFQEGRGADICISLLAAIFFQLCLSVLSAGEI